MKVGMVTHQSAGGKIDWGPCTGFAVHKAHQKIFDGIQHKIIDYTEHRLLRYAADVTDQQQKLVLMAMVHDYRAGLIAIAWKRGRPMYLRVT